MRRPISASIVTLFIATAAHAVPTITNLGTLPGGTETFAFALSADGTTVVGQAYVALQQRAFRWTAATGVTDIGPGDLTLQSGAFGVNSNGSVVVGSSGNSNNVAFRWTAATGPQSLGLLPGGTTSIAANVNADGSIVIGQANTDTSLFSFRWTAATELQPLPLAPGFSYSLGASGISADGSVIVGTNGNKAGVANADRAYRYTDATGYQDLGVQPGFTRSTAKAVSGDGQTVIGMSQLFPPPSGFAAYVGAFRWTASTGLVPLFLDDETYSYPDAVTYDGSRIVGSSTGPAGPRAVLWTSTLGSLDLNAYLPTLGLNLTGWNLTEATGISSNGSILAGTGTFNGTQASWIIAIPEPTSLLAACGLALPLLRRRRA